MPKFAKFHIRFSSKGFTIVELLLAMGLISILLVSLTGIFTASLEMQLRSQATSSRQEDAEFILSRLYYDVNQATTITTPSSINAHASTLVLTVNGQSWTYALSDGNLILTTPTSSTQLNSYLTTVTAFDVKRVGNATGKASVQIAITVGSRIEGSGGADTVSYTTTYTKF